jgi:hypothetical protein
MATSTNNTQPGTPYVIDAGWGSSITMVNNRVLVSDQSTSYNVARRLHQVSGVDYDSLLDSVDDTIYELIPRVSTLPSLPPPKAAYVNNMFIANWGMLADSGGSTDSTKDIAASTVRRWNHDWPALYGISPVYKFYTGDNPLFYIYNPVSYIDPETDVAVLPDKITWKLNGEDISTGNYLQLFNVTPTEARKVLTVEISNTVGISSRTILYEIVDSDSEGDAEGFSSTYGGSFIYNPTAENGRGKAVFEPDPRYQPRRVKVKIRWSNYGNGKNRHRKFRKKKPTIKVDGENMINSFSTADGTLIVINDGNDVQTETLYFDKPPGPLTIEVGTKFKFANGFKRKRRVFHKNFSTDIDLDSPTDTVIDLGTITVSKHDEDR